MEYRTADVEKAFECKVIGKTSDGAFELEIDGKKSILQMLNLTPSRLEFVLDDQYHNVEYLKASTSAMEMIVDGVQISLDMHSRLDEIVYKNSGGANKIASDSTLYSTIPGKVISVAVKQGDAVTAGDTICTLESMKMQIGVKTHHDGTVSSLKVEVGNTIAKGDVIAEIE